MKLKKTQWLLVCVPNLFVPATFAQTNGSITFTPDSATAATTVPTLGGAMLIMLAVLLGFIAIKAVRRNRQHGGTVSLLAGALLTGSLASAVPGVLVIKDVHAGGGGGFIVNPEGETLPVNCFLNRFTNQTDISMTVTELTPPTGCDSETNTAAPPICAIGITLENGESCDLRYERTIT